MTNKQLISWVDVTSSNIRQVFHDPASNVFAVKFHNGGIYSYNDVDVSLFDTIQTAPSVGRYFNMMIKGYHNHTKWSSEAELADYMNNKRRSS